MLELKSFIKKLPRAPHPESDQSEDTFLVGKYKSPEEIEIILNRLQPTSLIIQGLTVHQALGIFEAPKDYPNYLYPYSNRYIILTSKKGQQLLNDKKFFIQLEQNPAHLPGAQEVDGNFHSRVYKVPYPQLDTFLFVKVAQQIGHEPYEAIGMKLLESEGLFIPDHLITTQSRSVTQQAEGVELTKIQIDPDLEELVEKRMELFRNLVDTTISKLTQQKLWPPYNGAGCGSSLNNKSHFYIRNLNNFLFGNPEDLKNSVTVVDGVTYQTNDIHCLFAR